MAADDRTVSYTQQVRPILSDKCFACHGPDKHTREAGLRLDTREAAIADLGGYAAIVPGDPARSELAKRIRSHGEGQMPPASTNKPLTEQEIKTLNAWITEGAEYEQHWSYRPLQRPKLPVEGAKPVDAFLTHRLSKQAVPDAKAADKRTLVRRLYLDLLGVPPRPEDVDRFLKDKSSDSWTKLVDRLLADPRYGERMAVYWLDLVRYADTIGYHSDNFMEVSAYRDYVINAFNQNKRFDQFTIEQLAGDLLESPTREQLIASGYNRLLQTTEEGGSQAKEYIAIYGADRVRNVSGVWMGQTMGCAQCHDHKYDPITARDFYTMSAFFADIAELPVGARDYNMYVPSPKEDASLQVLRDKLAELSLEQVLESDADLKTQVDKGQHAWEVASTGGLKSQKWICPSPTRFESNSRLKLNSLPDNSVVVSDASPYDVTYEVRLPMSGDVRSIRLDTLTHFSFRGENRYSNDHRDFVLTEFEVTIDGKLVKIASAKADFVQPGFPVHHLFDGNEKTGWAIAGHPKQDRISVVLRLAEPLALGDKVREARVRMVHRSIFGRHHVGRFRISYSSDAKAPLDSPDPVPQEVREVLATPRDARNAEQQGLLARYYQTISPELSTWRAERDKTVKKKLRMEDGMRKMLIAESLSEPRTVRILPRGNWQDDSGEVVLPAVPPFLPSKLPSDRRLTRVDLAHWLLDRDNPLTARVFVNRLWKLFYGQGISRDLADVGGQGSPPTHPELLDWLAVEFIDSGWDVKHLVRLLVTSNAYQRTSTPTDEQLASDPTNHWFSRQNRWRVDAEFVRDAALSISGLLHAESYHGASIKPYQPAGYWRHLNFPTRKWHQSQGADLHRRSVYTFWCRTFLHPSMLAFDAPTREECTAQRARSNIPQQALVLMNDPIFVEAARVLAEKITKQEGDPASKAAWAVRQMQMREADQDEIQLLADYYTAQRDSFARTPKDAKKLIGVGTAPQASGLDAVEVAAWTQVVRALFASYETTSRF